MEREDVIELGIASHETRGIGLAYTDDDVLQNSPGLSND